MLRPRSDDQESWSEGLEWELIDFLQGVYLTLVLGQSQADDTAAAPTQSQSAQKGAGSKGGKVEAQVSPRKTGQMLSAAPRQVRRYGIRNYHSIYTHILCREQMERGEGRALINQLSCIVCIHIAIVCSTASYPTVGMLKLTHTRCL
jgi:hypothetical protein